MDVDILISHIHQRPALWDKKNKLYANRAHVDKLWSEISGHLKCNENLLRKKWKYLRDQFSVELGKVSSGRVSDTPGDSPSKWQYYQSLIFLKDVVKPRLIPGSMLAVVSSDTLETSVQASSQHDSLPEASADDQPERRQEKRQRDEREKLLTLACKRLCQPDDEYLQLARVWATELSKMDKSQQVFAKKSINDILFEGQMGTLNRHSIRINGPLNIEK